MTYIKRAVVALALCAVAVSVAHAQQQAPALTDSRLDTLFPGTAGAQKQQPATGKDAAAAMGLPVTCTALTIKSLDGRRHSVDASIAGVTNAKLDARGAYWVFKDGVLEFIIPNVQHLHLVVGETTLKGWFKNFNAPSASVPDLTYNCNGPIERVIVR